MEKYVAVYLRVSTKEQSVETQKEVVLSFLDSEGIDRARVRLFMDKVSGKTMHRTQFALLKNEIMHRRVETLVLYKLDRLSRSGTLDVLQFLEFATNYGSKVLFATQPFLNQENDMMRTIIISVLSEFAKFEREQIVHRVKAGMERAQRKGTRSGKPIGRQPKRDTATVRLVRRLLSQGGLTKQEVANRAGISRSHLYVLIKDHDLDVNPA